MITPKTTIQTIFQAFSTNPYTGKRTALSAPSPNLILDSGLNIVGQEQWNYSCRVGVDSTPPAILQDNLLGFRAATSTVVENVWGAQATVPYFGWKRVTYRFSTAAIHNQNLSEVGIGYSNQQEDPIVSRALFIDLTGNQTTVTPLPGESLDVVVEYRLYPPLSDVTGVVTVAGEDYNYAVRAAYVTSSFWWGELIGSRFGSYSTYSEHWSAFDGALGPITGGPSGNREGAGTSSDFSDVYLVNSHRRGVGITSTINGWVLPDEEIKCLTVGTTGGAYQVSFDSVSNPGHGIPKTANEMLTARFYLNWGRYIA